MCAFAAPGGVASIVAKNAHTLAVRPALAGDWHTALDAFDTDRQINGLGVNTRGDTIEGLSELLTRYGVASRGGVRVNGTDANTMVTAAAASAAVQRISPGSKTVSPAGISSAPRIGRR